MSKRRDSLFLRSGLMIGFGAGLCIGLLFVIFSLSILLHHMFIIGVQWTAPGLLILLILLPVLFIMTGVVLHKRARGVEA